MAATFTPLRAPHNSPPVSPAFATSSQSHSLVSCTLATFALLVLKIRLKIYTFCHPAPLVTNIPPRPHSAINFKIRISKSSRE